MSIFFARAHSIFFFLGASNSLLRLVTGIGPTPDSDPTGIPIMINASAKYQYHPKDSQSELSSFH